MSLCYDFQKWTMITLASIAISLTVGLVLMQYAHGQTANLQTVLDYCIAHADRVAKGENVIQDLIKSGIIEDIGPWTCGDVAKEKIWMETREANMPLYQECLRQNAEENRVNQLNSMINPNVTKDIPPNCDYLINSDNRTLVK